MIQFFITLKPIDSFESVVSFYISFCCRCIIDAEAENNLENESRKQNVKQMDEPNENHQQTQIPDEPNGNCQQVQTPKRKESVIDADIPSGIHHCKCLILVCF